MSETAIESLGTGLDTGSYAEAGLQTPEITVLGIGNLVVGDEGFGVRAAELLDERYECGNNVQVIDGGTLGMELLPFVTGTQKLLVLDSINGGQEPGTMFCFKDDEVMAHFQDKMSTHEVGIQDVLTLLKVTDKPIPHVTVIGAQPYKLGAGVGLSPEMERLLEPIVEKAVEQLREWNADVKAR